MLENIRKSTNYLRSMGLIRRAYHQADRLWQRLGRKIFGPQVGFYPSSVIQQQHIIFPLDKREFGIYCDHKTPLYDTIAEVVDYDCYQIRQMRLGNSPSTIILDAGGNVGVTSIVLSHYFPHRVVVLEPLATNRVWLQKNLAVNGVSTVEVWPEGLGGTTRIDRLWYQPDCGVDARLAPEMTDQTCGNLKETPIQLLDIEDILKRTNSDHIALLKMDIEGAEHEVVRAITQSLANRIDNISLEAHDHDSRENGATLCARLKSLGYLVNIRPERLGRRGLSQILAQRRL